MNAVGRLGAITALLSAKQPLFVCHGLLLSIQYCNKWFSGIPLCTSPGTNLISILCLPVWVTKQVHSRSWTLFMNIHTSLALFYLPNVFLYSSVIPSARHFMVSSFCSNKLITIYKALSVAWRQMPIKHTWRRFLQLYLLCPSPVLFLFKHSWKLLVWLYACLTDRARH